MSNSSKTVVVSIGRNIGQKAMTGEQWRKFAGEVRETLRTTSDLVIISEPHFNLGRS